MSTTSLTGKRILVTQAGEFMGPELCAVLAEHGATVIADMQALADPAAPAAVIAAAGHIDVLVANLAISAPSTEAVAVSEAVSTTEGFAIVLCDLKSLLETGRSGRMVRDKAVLIAAGTKE